MSAQPADGHEVKAPAVRTHDDSLGVGVGHMCVPAQTVSPVMCNMDIGAVFDRESEAGKNE